MFPRTFEYRYGTPDGEERTEEAALFGDLVQAVELAADLEEADPDDPEGPWTRPLPDMMPGTNAQRGRRHGHGKLHKQLSVPSIQLKLLLFYQLRSERSILRQLNHLRWS